MKISTKNTLVVAVISLTFLNACHKENALLTQNEAATKKILMSAQVVSAKKTHFYSVDGAFNYAYCIDHVKDENQFVINRCDHYMQAMLQYIVKQAGYSQVSLLDLKNKHVIHRLGDLNARSDLGLAHEIIRSV